ncbi:MAG TPA: YncE family protein [Gemmatimonadales bacterium]|nr:YncE family protein [Gemmatimonadales bacterium]
MRPRRHHAIAGSALLMLLAGAPLYAQSYHVAKTFTLGGDGGWDYVTLDTVGHRLFVARQDRVMVIDPTSGKLLAEIPGLNRAHGVAFSYRTGKGFATSGGDSSVVVFDLKTLKVLGRTTAAVDADAVLFDPATKHVFTFNGDAGSSSVIDATSGRRIGSIDLGGKPEFGVTTGTGRLYVNIEDSSAVAEIDPAARKVTRRWSLAPCESPTGLAIDRARAILFSGCRNGVMAISDAKSGKLITTVPIGQGVDAARFDPATQLAFASNGEGTITVIHEDAQDKFTVVGTVQTKRGARTMELDLKTHRLFTVTADFGPPPAATADRPRPRPPVLPGTFALLELDP